MRRIGIQDFFSYYLPMAERYRVIREAGFDSVMLGWAGFADNPDETKHQNPELARSYGLYIENMHTNYIQANDFWLDTLDGIEYLKKQTTAVEDCAKYEIPVMVLHINQGMTPPPITNIGVERLKQLITKAEDKGIYLAFENMRSIEQVQFILTKMTSDYVKFCFDCGHNHCKTPQEDLLSEFGDKLAAVHLHDNHGTEDEHKLPYDGTINWNEIMRKIDQTPYQGGICLEVGNTGYENLSALEFLREAYQRAQKLGSLPNQIQKKTN